jgi:riboflavin kinase
MGALNILIYLAKKGALSKPVVVTTCNMGQELGISQQSVSRWLMLLEKKGLTARNKAIRGYMVQITEEGKKCMKEMKNELEEALAGTRRLVIKGTVASGMDEGRYYVGKKQYLKRIEKKLGFRPYPGTLNLRLNAAEDGRCNERLHAMKGVEIASFREDDRSFGGIKCFRCEVGGLESAVIIPERSHYGTETLDVISPHNLRKKLGLSEGEYVKVVIDIGDEEL